MIAFKEFPKIPRLNREIVVTEKIDGTNAAVRIELASDAAEHDPTEIARDLSSGLVMFAQSRSKFVTPYDDNHGFAAWVKENATDLFRLGLGTHYGEWWGPGINKRYGQLAKQKRFSLFNTSLWGDAAARPACCDVVPVLYKGAFSQTAIDSALLDLATGGSVACPGCTKPEGIIVFHTAANALFKATIEKDQEWKGNQAASPKG